MNPKLRMLLMSGPPRWMHRNAVYAANFSAGQYYLNRAKAPQSAIETTTRAGSGWLDSIGGAWSEFLSNVARRTDRGLAVGGAFTNKIRNPRGEGGTVGVIGSGGVLPTNWAVEQAMSGVATSFVGAGNLSDGRSYIDIGLSGTLSGANALIIRMESATYATASAGQAWGLDFGSKLQAGTTAGLSAVEAHIRDSAAVLLAESSESGLSGAETRLLAKGVTSGTPTSVYPRFVVDSLNNGAAVDATIRIYAPKLVQIYNNAGVAGYMPDFPILPAVGVPADSTKAADAVQAVQATEGSELVSNPGPFTDYAAWVADSGVTQSIVSAGIQIEATDPSTGNSQIIATVVGKAYRLLVDGNRGTSSALIIRVGVVSVLTFSSATRSTKYYDFVATSASTLIAAVVGTAGTSHVFGFSVKRLTPFAGWEAAGSELIASTITHVDDGVARPLFEYSDGTANNIIRGYLNSADKPTFRVITGGVTQVTATLTTAVTAGNSAFAFGWSASGGFLTNGTEIVTFGAISIPTVTQKRIGSSVLLDYFNDILRIVEGCYPLTSAEAAAEALRIAA